MKSTTRTLLASLILAGSAGLAAVPALAQGHGKMADCGGMREGMAARHGERMKERQQKLHDALKLNPEQEKAWAQYQESAPFAAMSDGQRPNKADFEKLTPPERAEKQLEQFKKHEEAFSRHVAALKTFYGQLTPEQKKVFDEQHMQRPQRGPRGGDKPAAPPQR